MSSIIGRAALRATPPLRESGINAGKTAPPLWKQFTHSDKRGGYNVLRKGAKKDPELYPLYLITAGMLGIAGWHLARFPTSGADESEVAQVPHSEPWKGNGGPGKYQYYPQGDVSRKPKNAPSALNTVIVPNVNLPKELHDRYNKWGKEEFDF